MTKLSRVVFAVLVTATFAAFFAAQRLKTAPTLVQSVRVSREFFSPNGDGVRDRTAVSFRLKRADDVTVDIVDADGDRVRRIATDRSVGANGFLRAPWDGRTDDGSRAPDGVYRPRITLRREGRSVVIRTVSVDLDVTPPEPVVVRTFIPGHAKDHPADAGRPLVTSRGTEVAITVGKGGTRVAPVAQIVRTDGDAPELVRTLQGSIGSARIVWDGMTESGDPAPDGTYLVRAIATDRAGNRGASTPSLRRIDPSQVEGLPGITVRGLAVQGPLDQEDDLAETTVAGAPVRFFVDARGRRYRWSVRRVGSSRIIARGSARSPELTLPAPRGRSGMYLIQLRAGADTTRAPFLVQATGRAPLLVVMPLLTWRGLDRIDDDGDGLPNTLLADARVALDRPWRGEEGDGLPAGVAAGSAPLLAYLDRMGVPYDLTSDLELLRDPDGLTPDTRPGVLLAGPERWLPRSLARRLREYVTAGGRVASFGADALRRGVDVTDTQMLRQTTPTSRDVFGNTLRRLRRIDDAPADGATTGQLVPLTEQDPRGLLVGVDPSVGGFTMVEESERSGRLVGGMGIDPGPQAPVDPATGRARTALPAIAATTLGDGLVIRVGLPQWGTLLQGDPDVQQLTHNVADILRGVRPKVRTTHR